MAVSDEVVIKFRADTAAFGAGLKNAQNSLSRFGTNAFFLGSRITAGIGVPIALLTKAIVGIGAAFDQAMTESLAIMGRDGQQMRGQMEAIAKSIALQTKFSAEEAAQAYFFLASSGLNAAESMKALPVAAQFAQAGVIDLEKATELLSDAYITLGLRSTDPIQNMENMTRVADVLTEANNRAQGTIIEFAQALTNRAGVAFRTFNIDVEEGVAALAAFAERGIKGRTAGRQLFIVIRDLQRAVLKNNDAWEKLIGPDAVFSAAEGDFKNLADIIGTLEGRLEGMTDKTKKITLQMLGFQERSLQATLALIGASDRIKELEGHLRSAGGVTQRVAEKQMMSFTNQLSLVSERLKQVGIDLFDAFRSTIERDVIPIVRSLIQRLQGLVIWLKTLSPETKKTIVGLMALAVALGPVVAAVGALSLAMIPLIVAIRSIAPVIKFTTTLSGLTLVIQTLKTATIGLWTAFTTIGATWLVAQASLKVVGFALLAFMGKVTALGVLLLGTWKIIKSITGSVIETTVTWNNLSSSIGTTTIRLIELINQYKQLNIVGPLTENNANLLAHTEEMLAAAMGMSADAFRQEASAGRGLLNILEKLIIVEFEAGKATIEQHAQKKADLEEEAKLIRDKITALTTLLNLEMGAGADVRGGESRISAVGMVGQLPAGGWETVAVGEEERAKFRKELEEQISLLRGVAEALKDVSIEEETLRTSLGLVTQEMRIKSEVAEKGRKDSREQEALDRIELVNKEALENRIESLHTSLKGLSGDGLVALKAAWDLLSPSEQANKQILERLNEAYSSLREGLAAGELPADIERLTQPFRDQAAAAAFAASTVGKVIASMAGFDSVANEWIKDQDKIIQQFNDLEGVMDPRFFEEHGAMLETLAEHYGDQLEPGLQEIIKAYEEWKKISTATTDSVVKDQKKASISINEASDRMTASMMDKRAELASFTLSAQDAEIVGLKKGYNIMKFNHAKTIGDMIADVALLPEAQRHAAIMRVEQARKAAEEMLEAEERIGLLRMLKALGIDDRILRNHEKFKKKWLLEEAKRLDEARDKWEEYHIRVAALTSVAGLFSELGKIIPSLSGIGSALSGVASATGAWGTSIEQFSKSGATAFDKVTASAGMATAAMSAFFSISQMGSRAGRTAMGAMTGAQMGAGVGQMVGGPAGAAVGAAIGGLVGGISGLLMKDPGWKKIGKTIQKQWNVSVTEELSKEIEKTAKDVGNDWGAALLHINQVIEESGGVTAQNVEKWTRKVRDAFSMIDMGVFTAAEAAEVLNENFAALAEAGTLSSGVLKANVAELMLLDEKFGTASEAIKKFKDAMMDMAVTGLEKFASGVTIIREKLVETFEASIEKAKEAHEAEIESQIKLVKETDQTQQEIEAIRERGAKHWETILQGMQKSFREGFIDKTFDDWRELNTFTELTFLAMTEGGMSFLDALDKLEPSLAELNKMINITGENGGDAIDQLLRIRDFKIENEGLILQVQGLNELMLGLANAGHVSQESFTTFSSAAARQFDTLISKGLNNNEALLLMLPTLQTLSDMQKEYGILVHEDAQKILDLAAAKGMLGEKAKSIDEQMLEGINKMVAALENINHMFSNELPASMSEMKAKSEATARGFESDFIVAADRIQDQFDDLNLPDFDDINLRVNFSANQFDPEDYMGSGEGWGSYQHGGIITKPTLAMTGEGGQPELIGPVGFMSKALEGAISRTGPSEVEREMLSELHGLRSDLKTLPIHLRDALILAG
jgi:TP901 family phage tail tape measure protein